MIETLTVLPIISVMKYDVVDATPPKYAPATLVHAPLPLVNVAFDPPKLVLTVIVPLTPGVGILVI